MPLAVHEARAIIDREIAEQEARAAVLTEAAAAKAAVAAQWCRPLSKREIQIVDLASHGHSNAEIAERLHLAGNTVKTHMRRIGVAIGCGDRAGIVGACFRAGVIQ